MRIWDAEKDRTKPALPEAVEGGGSGNLRVTLAAPPWSALGWEENNPGFVYWYCGQREEGPELLFGKRMPAKIRMYHAERKEEVPRVSSVTLIAHRFSKGKGKSETAKDKFIYHEIVLLEWDHGNFCTVVEMGGLSLSPFSGVKRLLTPPPPPPPKHTHTTIHTTLATLNGTKRFRCLYQADRDEKMPKMIGTLPACM